ncbi:WxL domain-containing protein [Enterococcus faecium]|uniref:WxL domain-containing protein n=1 Tax=Enterococcus faecium TaxID=1352 RepID=UPI003515F2D7
MSAGSVAAVSYPEDTKAETEGKVTILQNDEPDIDIPDPDDPTNPPVIPDDAEQNELKGASLKFSNVRYNTTDGNTTTATKELTLNKEEQVIAKATNEQGAGSHSLVLGTAQDDGTTDCVILDIPANTVKNNTEYKTRIVWEFIADPTDSGDDNNENTGDQA